MSVEYAPWLERTPLSWQSIPIKRIVSARDGGSWGEEINIDDENIICMRIADFDFPNGKFKLLTEDNYTVRSYNSRLANKLLLNRGDILVEKSGGGEKTPVGRSVIFTLPYKALFANFMDRIRVNQKKVIPEYVEYYFRAMYYKAVPVMYIKQTTGIQNLDLTALLSNEKILLPSLNEQKSIVEFLDKKGDELSEMISSIKTSIEEYRTLRQATISQAVTRGIKPNRELKESGLNWLPEIPIEWEPIPAKALFKQSNLRALPGDEQLTASQKYGIISQTEYMEKEQSRIVIATQGIENWKHVEPNDFIISLRSFQGGLELSKVVGCITWHYIVLKPSSDVWPPYFKWLFKSAKYINALQSTCNFIRDGQDLRYSNFVQVRLFKIPHEEQVEIANYLDERVSQIDSIISEKQLLIEQLESYKKSLIFNYVTGRRASNQ